MKLLIILVLLSTFGIAQEKTASLLSLKNDNKNLSSDYISSFSLNNPEAAKLQTGQPGKKSGFTAVLYSLLLPGMGELYAGNYNRGKYFTIAEGVFWGFYAGFNVYGNWQRDNYKSFASSDAGVNPANKDADFYAAIGEVNSVNEWNRLQSLDRNFVEMYDKDNEYWNWQDTETRTRYRNMWLSSEQSFNNVRFAVGALIVNRIVSAINAALMVRSYNKKLTETGWNLYFNTDQNLSYQLGVSVTPF